MEELITLPGVGRKTANVILGNAFGQPSIVVDTHVKARGEATRSDQIRQSRPGRTRPAAAPPEIPVDGCLATSVTAWPLCLPCQKTPVPHLSSLPALPMERERSAMIRSMTGFGRRQAPWQDGSVTVEMRSVNHRFLEIACRLPRPLSHLEDSFKKAIQQALHPWAHRHHGDHPGR